MPKTEAPLEAIKKYIPDKAAQLVLDYLNLHKVHLTITRERNPFSATTAMLPLTIPIASA